MSLDVCVCVYDGCAVVCGVGGQCSVSLELLVCVCADGSVDLVVDKATLDGMCTAEASSSQRWATSRCAGGASAASRYLREMLRVVRRPHGRLVVVTLRGPDTFARMLADLAAEAGATGEDVWAAGVDAAAGASNPIGPRTQVQRSLAHPGRARSSDTASVNLVARRAPPGARGGRGRVGGPLLRMPALPHQLGSADPRERHQRRCVTHAAWCSPPSRQGLTCFAERRTHARGTAASPAQQHHTHTEHDGVLAQQQELGAGWARPGSPVAPQLGGCARGQVR